MINQEGLDLIKRWEGFRSHAYKDSGGVWTIGYGTTSEAGVGITVHPGMEISRSEAERYLREAVDKFAKKIRPYITAPIKESEFAAFVSLAYNIGPGAFIESTALRRFNDGDKIGAAEAMLWWNKVNGNAVEGLMNRRKKEVDLFLKSPERVKTPIIYRIGQWLRRKL